MEIATLKDLKEAMKDIPDEVLEVFGVGFYEEEHLELLCWKGNDAETTYMDLVEKHPILKDIGKWITNMAKVQDQATIHNEDYETDEPISSEDKIEIKPKKE